MKTLSTLILILISSIGIAQSSHGEIRGKVVDALDNTPFPFASVSVTVGTSEIKVQSDLDGKFVIKAIPPGEYQIMAQSMGTKYLVTGVQVAPEKITFVEDMKVGLLEEFIAIYEPQMIDPEDTKVITIDADYIKHLPVRSPEDIAVIASSEVSKGADGQLHFRGARAGDLTYYIDGVKVMGTTASIPGRSIQNMRVYTGGIPAKYGDTMGGVVMVETKNYFQLYNAWKAEQN